MVENFDYVIVGASAAGCVLTNRLTEEATGQGSLIRGHVEAQASAGSAGGRVGRGELAKRITTA